MFILSQCFDASLEVGDLPTAGSLKRVAPPVGIGTSAIKGWFLAPQALLNLVYRHTQDCCLFECFVSSIFPFFVDNGFRINDVTDLREHLRQKTECWVFGKKIANLMEILDILF